MAAGARFSFVGREGGPAPLSPHAAKRGNSSSTCASALRRGRSRTAFPTISGRAQFADGGNPMTYGANLQAACHRLGWYVDRILKGTRPAELPVELPTRFELVVNPRTARTLGITIAPVVMVRADRIIQ